MNKESNRWFRQAEADLKAATDSLRDSNHEWSCFQSQQAGEKFLKAYLYNKGYTSILTHSIKKLVGECQKRDEKFVELEEAGRILDAYYIPTRYPNGLDDEMAPVDYYDKKDAEKCLNYAISISKIVKKYMTS